MSVLHVQVESDDGWPIAQGLEDRAVITQGRTLDEIFENVREVLDLLRGARDTRIELILPATVRAEKKLKTPRRPPKPRTQANGRTVGSR